ncbi:MAG: hypothetical protein EBT96_10770 [Betaproteobacteria bacterium]|nr:hypothetical protein [Betaproteobacteria bacterium]
MALETQTSQTALMSVGSSQPLQNVHTRMLVQHGHQLVVRASTPGMVILQLLLATLLAQARQPLLLHLLLTASKLETQ